jgi:hypothetical protein
MGRNILSHKEAFLPLDEGGATAIKFEPTAILQVKVVKCPSWYTIV